MSAKDLAAKNIKRIRKQTGLTQEALAKKCGISVRYVWHLENAGANTTLDTLEAVARGLGCTLLDLLRDHGFRKNRPPRNTKPGIAYAIHVLSGLTDDE